MRKSKKTLTGIEKKVATLRARGLSYRAIDAKLGHDGNGTWALRMARKAGVA